MSSKVKLPQRLMMATEVLNEVFLQTGLAYAYPTGALPRQVDVGPLGGEAAIEAILRLLAPAISVRENVALLEANLDDATLEALSGKLASGDADERRLAAYQLGCTKSTRAIAPLLTALADKDEGVRHHALRSLDRLERDWQGYHPAGRVSIFTLGKRYPTGDVVEVLKSAPDPTTNEWVWSAQLLARMPARGAAAALRKAVQHPYPRTRRAAEEALAASEGLLTGGIAPGKWGPEAQRGGLSPAWAKALESADAAERVAAARLLALRNDIGAETLLGQLKNEKDLEVRAEILLALGRKGGQAAWDAILKEVVAESSVVRLAAARALERCPDPRAIEPLMQALTRADTSTDERNVAAASLGMVASPAVVKRLSDYIQETIAAGRLPISVSVLALGWTGDPTAVPALAKVAALSKKDQPAYGDVQKGFAFGGLARIGTREAAEALMSHYDDWDNTARFCGHSGVRLSGHVQEAVDRYVETVKAGRGRIAPHGLEEAEDPRATDALVEQLPKSTGSRLHFLVQALGRIGDPRAVPALIQALDHRTEWVSHEAMRALRWRWYWHRLDVQEAFKRHPVFKAFVTPPPSVEEQPENTWVCRLWPIDFDDQRACNTTYEAGLVYDGRSGKVVKWGSHGQRCDTPQSGETWLYDASENTWKRSEAPVEPFGMCGTWGLAYDRANEAVVSVQLEGGNHGWQWDRGRSLRASVPWVYHGASDRWVPVRPAGNPGQRGFLPLAYLDAHQVTMLYGGQGRAIEGAEDVCLYDAYANTWHYLPQKSPNPGLRNHNGLVYLPGRDLVLLYGGTRNASTQTWLYDVKANTWRDAAAGGNPPAIRHTIKYDPLTGTVLAFRISSDRPTVIWQYDPEKNGWKTIPPPPEPTPHYESVDVAYDPVNNVWVLDGGHINWNTDHIGVREVWTYRLKNAPPDREPRLPAPTGVSVDTRGGKCVLTWQAVPGAAGYVVYRGTGAVPWQTTFGRVTPEPLKATSFTDSAMPPAAGSVPWYYVAAVDGRGVEGVASLKVCAQPAIPQDVVASVLPDGTVALTWASSPASDVVGYHVDAAAIQVGERMHMSSMEKFEAFTRLTDKPIMATEFTDTRPLKPATGLFNHEVRTYQVRAANARGVESGPSPLALTLTSSVPRVTATEQTDGTTLIRWEPVPEKHIRGYAVYRMDEFRGSFVIRLNPRPVTGTSYVDRPETPRAERRRYYVVAVDALNEEGLPSTGAYAFGRP